MTSASDSVLRCTGPHLIGFTGPPVVRRSAGPYRCTYAGAVLVLTRNVGESVVIGDEVIVKVIEVRGDVVRLGVEAPSSVRIYREELYRELVEANRAAAAGPQEELSALLAQAAKKRQAGKPQ